MPTVIIIENSNELHSCAWLYYVIVAISAETRLLLMVRNNRVKKIVFNFNCNIFAKYTFAVSILSKILKSSIFKAVRISII